MRQYEQIIPSPLQRTSSCKSTSKIVPASHKRSTSSYRPISHHGSASSTTFHRLNKTGSAVSCFLRSILSIFTIPAILPTCRWLSIPSPLSITPSLGRKVTGTLFGNRRGLVSFTVQDGPKSLPALIVELPVTTAALVKEMSSGLLRIALECKKSRPHAAAVAARVRLLREPAWTMYCNGRECGYAQARACSESDWHVLRTVQSVSIGAGMIPVVEDGGKGGGPSEGELLYMRARFERVVGNRDSEAFYMMNPDGSGGPELSIFLLRI
ncbi:protein mizu-kussei 1 [Phtheirospermum japonicum]|uniref:Protein mizu-kussei 1 n=1 Tax=Phtheirospermum japonicum TaxID=374723 RepID=A0A830BUX1_9LAMI|nr:protein mizu-kussei 1 [Phtheirospermum japonicum]